MEANPVDPILTPIWPEAHVEVFDENWPDLTMSAEEVGKWVITNKKVLVRTITWNLCANPPPSSNDICIDLLPKDRFHVYIVGTEECERSIAQSAWNPSKKSWEAYLRDAVGSNYIPLRSHTLQAIHLMAFVHKAIAPMCSLVTSAAVPTGMGSTLGNKGGVGLLFKIGETRLLIVNAHLAAHQTAEKRRNAEFNRINKMIPILLEKKEAAITSSQTNTPKGGSSGANNKLFALPFGFGISDKDNDNKDLAFTPTKDETAVQSIGISHRNKPQNNANINETTPNVSSIETIVGPHGEIVDVIDRGENDSSAVSAQDTPTAVTTGTGSGTGIIGTSSSPTGDIVDATIMKPSSQMPLKTPKDEVNQAISTETVNNKEVTAPTPNTTITDTVNSNNNNNSTSPPNNVVASTSNNNNESANNILGIDTPDEENIEADANRESTMDGTAILDVPVSSAKTLENTGDFVVFMGDLNYRIKGNRKIVSSLVENNMHEVLQHNDQLRWNIAQNLVLQGFTEGPLNFKPTYKYDVGTCTYDTSSKGRIPSWTDRILFIPRSEIQCLAYNAVDSITTSDHHPVYASFSIGIQISSDKNTGTSSGNLEENQSNLPQVPEFTSESQVCTIM